MKLRGVWLAHVALAMFAGSCFNGEFLAGQPCESDEECGPLFRCFSGQCATEDTGGVETTETSGGSTTATSSTTGSTTENTPPAAVDDFYEFAFGPSLSATESVLSNDVDMEGGLTVVESRITTEEGNTVLMQPDGRFTLDPGSVRGCDRFSYTVQDGAGETSTADVTVAIRLSSIAVDLIADLGLGARITTSCNGLAARDAGDHDGDGLSEVLLVERCPGESRVFIVDGSLLVDGETVTPDELLMAGADLVMTCPYHIVPGVGAGDVNGDGVDDVVLREQFVNFQPDRVHVRYGDPDAVAIPVSAGMPLTAPYGYTVDAEQDGMMMEVFDFTVRDVAIVEDVNGDDLHDVVFGINETAVDGKGRAIVIFGGADPQTDLDMLKQDIGGFALPSPGNDFEVNIADVEAIGDVNNDGLADIGLGFEPDSSGNSHAVFAPADSMSIPFSALNAGDAGLTLVQTRFLSHVSGIGDMDGDGFDDITLSHSDPNGNNIDDYDSPPAYIVFGRQDPEVLLVHEIVDGGGIEFTSGPGNTRVLRIFGHADTDGDGVTELVLLDDEFAPNAASTVTVLSDPMRQSSWSVSEIGDGVQGFEIVGTDVSDLERVHPIALDDDGRDELILQTYDRAGGGAQIGSSVYILRGHGYRATCGEGDG